MTQPLAIERRGGVAILRMQDPATRNALTDAMKAALAEAVAGLEADPELRAVVLTGTGAAFSSGGDLKGMLARHRAAGGAGESAESIAGRFEVLHGWLRRLRDLPVPVISAVNGVAYGAGFGLALTADIVLASEEARFCASFCKLGAVPDFNLFCTLPRMAGVQRARMMFLTGREIGAREAEAWGIVMEVIPAATLEERAIAMAEALALASPRAVRWTKQVTGRAFDLDGEALLAAEAEAQADCLTSAYHLDALDRFTRKLPPLFPGA
ncbi:enoyl-CoA hydratase/isomerase family protein [Tistrella mobilis]|uniref:enoyl-CoA hydratase/isomerase family protein n=1 Tax=Tistrella mobilis TaxID=171437 RepID=UPI003556A585